MMLQLLIKITRIIFILFGFSRFPRMASDYDPEVAQGYGSLSDSDKSVIFVRNPDSSLSEGLKPGFQFPKRPVPVIEEATDPALLYERNEGVFLTLVFAEFFLDAASLFNHLIRPSFEAENFIKAHIFHKISMPEAFWFASTLQLLFVWWYYGTAFLAVVHQERKWYRVFTFWALVGVAVDVTSAFLGGEAFAQLVIRMLSFVYARTLHRILFYTQLV